MYYELRDSTAVAAVKSQIWVFPLFIVYILIYGYYTEEVLPALSKRNIMNHGVICEHLQQ